MAYDIFTREQIICLFQFISNGKSGIPQSENDIISSFIGYLYLVFGDLFIDDILVSYKDNIDSHQIIRYTDDIYISITFSQKLDRRLQGSFIHLISSQIAEVLYSELGLKLNSKTRLHRLSKKEEKEEILKNIHKLSPNDACFSTSQKEDQEDGKVEDEKFELITETLQDKLNKIFEEIKKNQRI